MAIKDIFAKKKWRSEFEAGQAAMASGHYLEAEKHFSYALEKARTLSGDDCSLGDTALMLGQALRRQEKVEQSISATRTAFLAYSRAVGLSDPRTTQAHLSLILADRENAEQDEELLLSTQRLAREQFGESSWQYVRTTSVTFSVISPRDRAGVLQRAGNAVRHVLGPGRGELGLWPPVAGELAATLTELGLVSEAREFAELQLRLTLERYGERSDEVALARLKLGELAFQMGDYTSAESELKLALERFRYQQSKASEHGLQATVYLALVQSRQDRLLEAAPLLKEIRRSIGQSCFLADNPGLIVEALLSLLQHTCLVAADDAERGALWREVDGYWEEASDELKGQIFRGLLAAQRRLQEAWELSRAIVFCTAVLGRVRSWKGPHHPYVGQVLMELALSHLLSDDEQKALSFAQQSCSIDESLDNQIRAIEFFGLFGDNKEARVRTELVLKLLRAQPQGADLGKYRLAFTLALLRSGQAKLALDQGSLALHALPALEQAKLRTVLVEALVEQGQLKDALELGQKALEGLGDPYLRARVHIFLAWLLCKAGNFARMQDALRAAREIADVRVDHPLLFLERAVAEQGARASGEQFAAKELRKSLTDLLRRNHLLKSRRGLEVLLLLESFDPDESDFQLEIGEAILTASGYPEKTISRWHEVDVATAGLRHLIGALKDLGQRDIAQERLNELELRVSASPNPKSPWLSSIYLLRAEFAATPNERAQWLQQGVVALKKLHPHHKDIFSTLSLLAEQFLEMGEKEKAKGTLLAALDIRPSTKLRKLLHSLEGPTEEVGTSEDSMPMSLSENIVSQAEELQRSSSASVTQVTEFSSRDPEVALGGLVDFSALPMAVELLDRGSSPSEEEIQELLKETEARFGENPVARREALVTLALLDSECSSRTQQLWEEALDLIGSDSGYDLRLLEDRAKDAGAWLLQVRVLERQLRWEIERHGKEATETIETRKGLGLAKERAGNLKGAKEAWEGAMGVLTAWFGSKSLRLLEFLQNSGRLARLLGEAETALDYQDRVVALLEQNSASPEERFLSRVERLPLILALGRIELLLTEVAECTEASRAIGPEQLTTFATALYDCAIRLDREFWWVEAASQLLKTALSVLPEPEIDLRCRIKIATAEGLARKDYRSQAERLRSEALQEATKLPDDVQAELTYLAACSCLRTLQVSEARALAEQLLETRIACFGRKDVWGGRALLVLAEADLASYRLEGTETAIAMARSSLESTKFWAEADLLKVQALFFLGREEECYELLDSLTGQRALVLRLASAVWRGKAGAFLQEIQDDDEDSELVSLWRNLDSAPLAASVALLEFFARAGALSFLVLGLERLEERTTGLLSTDSRAARIQKIRAFVAYWELEFSKAEALLVRAVDNFSSSQVQIPIGLASLDFRRLLSKVLLRLGQANAALNQVRHGLSESADVLGEEEPRALSFRVQLAYCYQALGRGEEALLTLDRVLGPLQESLGEGHPSLAEVYRGLARVFLAEGDADSARMSAEEALEIDLRSRGPSLDVLEDLELLASATEHSDPEAAVASGVRACAMAEAILPAGHPYAEVLQKSLEAWKQAVVLAQERKHREAAEAERLRLEEEAAEAERLRLEEEAAEAERLRLEEEAAEAERLRLEEEAAEAERLRLEEEAAEAERLRLEEEAAEAERLRLEEEAAEAERLRLEEEAAEAERHRDTRSIQGPLISPAQIEVQDDFELTPFRELLLEELMLEELDPELLDSDAQQLHEPARLESLRDKVLNLYDPESFLLPLAPLYFLPFPWKDVTEAPVPEAFEELYQDFQDRLSEGGAWRQLVVEAICRVRLSPDQGSGYFIFLIGIQLERNGHLYAADNCLTTAVETMREGSGYGAACHLAGRIAGRRGELGRALAYFRRGLEVAEEAERAVLKVDAAECEICLGRPEEALLNFEEVFDYLAGNVPKVQALAVQAKMSQIQLLVGDPDASSSLVEDTEKRLGNRNSGTYRVLCRALLARAQASLGNYDKALEMAELAWKGAQSWSSKRREGRRMAISTLSDIRCLCGQLDESLQVLMESGFVDVGLGECELLLRAGHVACLLGKEEEAKFYLRLGRAQLDRFQSPLLWESAFHELEAEVALRSGCFQEAAAACERAGKLFAGSASGPVDHSRYLVRSARISAALGDLKQAQDKLKEAYALRDVHLGARHPHTESVEGLAAVIS